MGYNHQCNRCILPQNPAEVLWTSAGFCYQLHFKMLSLKADCFFERTYPMIRKRHSPIESLAQFVLYTTCATGVSVCVSAYTANFFWMVLIFLATIFFCSHAFNVGCEERCGVLRHGERDQVIHSYREVTRCLIYGIQYMIRRIFR